jgi:heme-degrading monooxygenase HmoA
MVVQVTRWNVHPDKTEAYAKWAEGAVKRLLAVPGVVEFRAYRPVTGAFQVVTTYEFADMASWVAWEGSEEAQKVLAELRTVALNVSLEVWSTWKAPRQSLEVLP